MRTGLGTRKSKRSLYQNDSVSGEVHVPNEERHTENYDTSLYGRSLMQWQFGDWQSLAGNRREAIENQPKRADLAVLVAAAHQQLGQHEISREFAHLGREWGCDSEVLARVLISGVYNTLGRAAVVANRSRKAIDLFTQAVDVGAPEGDLRLLSRARILEQATQLNASNSAVELALHQYGQGNFDLVPKLNQAKGSSLPQVGFEEGGRKEEKAASDLPKCLIQFNDDSQLLNFSFYGGHGAEYESGELKYELAGDKPLYLVSNETGNINDQPEGMSLVVEPDVVYELSGYLSYDSEMSPMVCVLEYADAKRLNGHWFRTTKGEFRASFRTHPVMEKIAFAVRLIGSGKLRVADCRFNLQSSVAIEVKDALRIEADHIDQQFKALRSSLEAQQKKQTQHALVQIEAFMSLQAYLGSEIVLPRMHGWPISPDLGLMIIRLLSSRKYDLIVEFGSGVSTLVVAGTIAKRGDKAEFATPSFLSFEHLQFYFEETKSILEDAKVDGLVSLQLTQLIEYRGPNGGSFSFYNCQDQLSQFVSGLESKKENCLVIVDGPPSDTGPMARYPALPLLCEKLAPDFRIDFLVDDYHRSQEQEIVSAWTDFLNTEGLAYTLTEFNNLEKGACLLTVDT